MVLWIIYSQYRSNIDVHYTSGIYNKAWCTLTKTPGWGYIKAFEVLEHHIMLILFFDQFGLLLLLLFVSTSYCLLSLLHSCGHSLVILNIISLLFLDYHLKNKMSGNFTTNCLFYFTILKAFFIFPGIY